MKLNYVELGNSLELMKKIPNASVDLIVTSPPYWNAVEYSNNESIGSQDSYNEYIENLLAIWKQCERVLVPNGKLCINTLILYKYSHNANT